MTIDEARVENVEVYLIRHVATKKLMPLMRRGKGYSHWNPAKNTEKLVTEMAIPRILMTERQAKSVISAWFSMPNADYRGYTTGTGEDDYDLCIKEDGRKKEDLEIVRATLVFDA